MRRAAVVPAGIAVALAASGWLYLLRPPLPGPRVGLALPLDELAHASAVPVAWFALVWLAAGLLLGRVARWARLERVAAAVALALVVGLWTYLLDGVSIAIVRQVPLRDALDAAARLHAVYLPAGFAALGGAVGAASRGRGRRVPLVVAFLVASGAVLDLLVAVLPGHNAGLVRSLAPDGVGRFARASHVPIAVALLLAARGLARRRQRAWQLATALAATSAALHVAHGVDHGTLATLVVLCVLVARRHDFDRPGDATRRVGRRATAACAGIVGYAVVVLWVNRLDADRPLTARFVLRELGAGVLGIHASGSPHLSGFFGEWFPLSLLLLSVGATGWIVAGWLAPWRYRQAQAARERALARALVRAWGADTLAPFALRADKSYFFADDGDAFVAYRVVGHVAIVSGDPIGPVERLDALLARFIEFAHERDWRVAILGASEQRLPLYRAHGLVPIYHGDEAVVDTAAFSLEGRAIRKVRQSVHRLEQGGFRVEVVHARDAPPELRRELDAVAAEWRGTQPERGFVMALPSLWQDDAVLVVGRDAAGRGQGCLQFAPSPACSALSLSSMPRRRDTPNGFNEWLICAAIAWARDAGFASVSLNFAPFAALLAPEAVLTPAQALQRRALLALKGHFQLDNLLLFNRKFLPQWQRRFVVVERRRDLPRVGVAALAVEAYLPFPSAWR